MSAESQEAVKIAEDSRAVADPQSEAISDRYADKTLPVDDN